MPQDYEEKVHKVILSNINYRSVPEGEKVKKLVDLAKEYNIAYEMGYEAKGHYYKYIDQSAFVE